MAGAYSADLRERVLLAGERGQRSRAKIAALFHIGESTLHRWLETWRSEGRREAKPPAGGPEPRLDAAALDELEALVAEADDLSPAEHAAKLEERAGERPDREPCAAEAGAAADKRPGGRRSGIGPRSPPPARPGGPSWPPSSRGGGCSWMNAGSTPA